MAFLTQFVDTWATFFGTKGTILDNIAVHLILTTLIAYGSSYVVGELGVFYDDQFHAFSGIGVGFLLVFRSNIAYHRYWEGRGHVGGMIASLRALTLLAANTIRVDPHTGAGTAREVELVKVAIQNHMQLMFALAVSHLDTVDSEVLYEAAQPYLDTIADEWDHLEALGKGCKPGKVILAIGWIIRDFSSARDAGLVDRSVPWQVNCICAELIKSFNGASKISRTPLPFPYKQLCAWLVTTFTYSAPFPYATAFNRDGSTGWGLSSRTMMASFFTTLAFFGIYATAMEIEDPFGVDANDLPLYDYQAALNDEMIALFQARNMAGSGEAAQAQTGHTRSRNNTRSRNDSKEKPATSSSQVTSKASPATDRLAEAFNQSDLAERERQQRRAESKQNATKKRGKVSV